MSHIDTWRDEKQNVLLLIVSKDKMFQVGQHFIWGQSDSKFELQRVVSGRQME
jgi:hypothetical protein